MKDSTLRKRIKGLVGIILSLVMMFDFGTINTYAKDGNSLTIGKTDGSLSYSDSNYPYLMNGNTISFNASGGMFVINSSAYVDTTGSSSTTYNAETVYKRMKIQNVPVGKKAVVSVTKRSNFSASGSLQTFLDSSDAYLYDINIEIKPLELKLDAGYGTPYIVRATDSGEVTFLTRLAAGITQRGGYSFSGWENVLLGYARQQAGETIRITDDTTYYAAWTANTPNIARGTWYLEAGSAYTLSGATSVSGDTTVYVDGMEFYVSSNEELTFR